jgi:hypothetical protein
VEPFVCSECGQLLFFDNSTCLQCSSTLGYLPALGRLVALREFASGEFAAADGTSLHLKQCANLLVARCNWMLGSDDIGVLCASCRLTSVRPSDGDAEALASFADAEAAKRRLLHQLFGLGLPVIDRAVDPEHGVAFEFLSSRNREVMTGHDCGVITLDLSESDDAHREFVRQQLGEAYRTVLGHLRHEIGHYYWPRLVVERQHLDAFRALFGDERASYGDALDEHYGDDGASVATPDWIDSYVSQYATMHPWEDWAETFAHYLHIDAGLKTARSFGFELGDPSRSAAEHAYRLSDDIAVGSMVQSWLGYSLALNAMSRSIGQGDLYPFVLSPQVIRKLDFVHRLVTEATL